MTNKPTWGSDPIVPIPDPGADELLAPIDPNAPPFIDPAVTGPSMGPFVSRFVPEGSTPAATTFEAALADGTIPSFEDQPLDIVTPFSSRPPDIPAERDAWQALLAFIAEHKDETTAIVAADPDTFTDGLI